MGVEGLTLLPTRFPAFNDRAEGFDVPDERPCKASGMASGQWVPCPEKQVPLNSNLDCGQWTLPRRPLTDWASLTEVPGKDRVGDASLYGEGSVTHISIAEASELLPTLAQPRCHMPGRQSPSQGPFGRPFSGSMWTLPGPYAAVSADSTPVHSAHGH